MMLRSTEAVNALHAALAAAAAMPGAAICVPRLNARSPERLDPFGPVGFFMHLNVLKGEGDPENSSSVLGADDPGVTDGYEVVWRAHIELTVDAPNDVQRATAFNAALSSIAAVIAADRTLGGVVDWTRMLEALPSENFIEGLDIDESVDIPVELTFVSSQPF